MCKRQRPVGDRLRLRGHSDARVFHSGPFTRAHATLPSAPEVNRVGSLVHSHPRLGRVHTDTLSPTTRLGEHATRGGTRDFIHEYQPPADARYAPFTGNPSAIDRGESRRCDVFPSFFLFWSHISGDSWYTVTWLVTLFTCVFMYSVR